MVAESPQRLRVPAEHEAAGGVAVEAMRDLRPARQAEAERVEVIGQRFAALRPRMHGQARRLVDDEHEAIAVEDAGYYVLAGGHGFGLTGPGPQDKRATPDGGRAHG